MCVLQRIGYSLLVAFCYRHLPPPNRTGLARQITEPASASDGRAARQVPARRQDLSYGGGSPGGETGLPAARGKAAARSSGSPDGRKGAGIRALSLAPAATRCARSRGTFC